MRLLIPIRGGRRGCIWNFKCQVGLLKQVQLDPATKLSHHQVLQSIQRFSSKYVAIIGFFACRFVICFVFVWGCTPVFAACSLPRVAVTRASLVAVSSGACGLSGCGGGPAVPHPRLNLQPLQSEGGFNH